MDNLASRLLPFALLVAGALFYPASARADAAPAAAPAAAAAESDPTLSFDFPGGSLSDLIALVEKTAGNVPLNVIGEKNAMTIEIQPFTVRNANRDGVLRAVGALLRSKGVRVEQVDKGVFIVSNDRERNRADVRPKKEATSFDSFQLGSYIDDQQTVDSIVDVIRSAWTMNPAHDANALQLKFHPGTKLLLVSGPSESIQMTREVIHSLHQSPKPLNAEERRLLDESRRLRVDPPPFQTK